MLRVTIWMNMPSFYQTDLFNDLIATGQIDLKVIYARPVDPERIKLGWDASFPHPVAELLPAGFRWVYAIWRAGRDRRRFHIVNGIWAEPSFAAALLTLIMAKGRYAIYSEAPESGQKRAAWKNLLRRLLGKFIAGRAQAVFAVSRFAEAFFEELGVKRDAIFPFGYFRAHPSDRPSVQSRPEIIFVGQFIERKGIGLLVDALRPLLADHPSWRLRLVGEGPQRSSIERRIAELGLEEKVIFDRAVPPRKIPNRLSEAAILVLPSLWDGWGLVVNEALAAGIPAIVSDQCGAMDLIAHGQNGYVFPSGNADRLREYLGSCMARPEELERLKMNAAQTGTKVGSQVAARYLLDCLTHLEYSSTPRPKPAWLEHEATNSI